MKTIVIEPLGDLGVKTVVEVRSEDETHRIVERWQRFFGSIREDGYMAPCSYRVLSATSWIDAVIETTT